MKVQVSLMLFLTAQSLIKRDHTDEASYGLTKLSFIEINNKCILGSRTHGIGSQGQFQMAWLDAMFDSDPRGVDTDIFG